VVFDPPTSRRYEERRASRRVRAGERLRRGLLRVLGGLWILAWFSVLLVASHPLQQLGGIVSERVRWLQYCVMGCAVIAGCLVGTFGRDAAHPGSGRTHLRLLRPLLGIPAGVTCAVLIVARIFGADGAIHVVFCGLLSYWAGLDLGFGAGPLVEGRDYSPNRPIQDEEQPLS